MRLTFAASRVLSGCHDIYASIYEMSEQLPDGDAAVMAMLPPPLLSSNGIGVIKRRKSKAERLDYLSSGCVHCDALQGRFFEHIYAFSASKIFETQVEFKTEWGSHLRTAGSRIYAQRGLTFIAGGLTNHPTKSLLRRGHKISAN